MTAEKLVTMEDYWQDFLSSSSSGINANPTIKRAARAIFFTGGVALMDLMATIARESETEDESIARMKVVSDEMCSCITETVAFDVILRVMRK